MARQEIHFCTTQDGVRIAFASIGAGEPLVYVTGWPVHLKVEWEKPFVRQFLEELAAGVQLVRYDMRGTGMSERDVTGLSFAAFLEDVTTVVDELGLERFALLSLGDLAGPLAIAVAAARPQSVTHLILNSGYARGADIATADRQDATVRFVESFGFPIFEFVDAPALDIEKQRGLREIQESAASHAVQAAVLRAMYAADVTPLLPRLTMPVLLMHARDDPMVPLAAGTALASQLPHARCVHFEGASASPWVHQHVLLREIRAFLGLEHAAPGRAAAARASGPQPLYPDHLTNREVEVLRLVTEGHSSREIAGMLVLSTHTVDRHIVNIYAKINVSTRAQATAYALRQGLVR